MSNSLASMQTQNTTSLQNEQKPSLRDFLLLCLPTDQGDALSEAVHALYYLPESFKLVVLSDMAASDSTKSAIKSDISVMDRIHFVDNTGKAAEASPFSHADVTISFVTSDTIAIENSNKQSTLIPSCNPEAFASAVLGIFRSQS